MNIDFKISFLFNFSLKVGHLEMVIHPIHNEVREPRFWTTVVDVTLACKKTAEKFKTFLTKVVAENLERHQPLVVG